MRVLVCGGRDFNSRAFLELVLDQHIGAQGHPDNPRDVLIHGAARGADTLAAEWGKSRGLKVIAFPADWKRHGYKAGFIRNQEMLDVGKPTLVIAFPGGPGTRDMVRRAKKAAIEVREISY